MTNHTESDRIIDSNLHDDSFLDRIEIARVGGYEWTDLCHLGLIGVTRTSPKLSGDPAAWPTAIQGLIDDAMYEAKRQELLKGL